MTQHVFILGAGRSGTKILRNCLGAASDVSAIPYDVGYVWRFGNEAVEHDELTAAMASDRTKKYVRRSISRMADTAHRAGNYQIILEKSVPNTLRPSYVNAIFPDCKFVHLIRDGRSVIESAMRNWEAPSDRGYFLDKLRYFPISNAPYAFWYLKNKLRLGGHRGHKRLWGPRYNGMQIDADTLPLVEVCARQWSRCVSVCENQLTEIESARVMQVRYEDFVESPDSIEQLCRFAGISDFNSVNEFYGANVSSDKAHSASSKLDIEQHSTITKIAGPALEQLGYV